MICCKVCGRMANGAVDTCPFCNQPLEVAAIAPARRMSEADLDRPTPRPVPAQKRFGNNRKVTDMQEWVAGRRKL